MRFKIKAIATAVSLAVALGAAQAHATIIDWTLSNGLFDDKGTFAGTFTFDSATDTITNWNVTTTAGAAFAGQVYATGCPAIGTCNNALDNGSGPSFGAFTFGASSVLELTDIPMGSPGSVALLTGSELGVIPTGATFTRNVVGGHAVGVVAGAPEPAGWAMMIAGFGLAGATLRRRKGLVAAA